MAKIDLHLHTNISQLNGDSISHADDPKKIAWTLFKHDVKIFSFTDHNEFDVDQFYEVKKIIKNTMTILPGIEVNMRRSDNYQPCDMLVIFPEDLSLEDLKKIKTICREHLNKNGLSVKKMNGLFAEFSTIRIPDVGKSGACYVGDLDPKSTETIIYDAVETSDEKSANFKRFLKLNVLTSIVAFSDTHKWHHYPACRRLYTDINLDNYCFADLKKALQTHQSFYKILYTRN